MATKPSYDLVVIGGGSGGLVAAAGAAMFGARVALVERRAFLGGDCLNFGCVPSKALIRTAHAAHAVSEAERFGVRAQLCPTVLADVMAYVRGVVRTIGVHDDADRFRKLGIDVLLGSAPTFLSPRSLQVGEQVLVARKFVIATGSRPATPAIPGLDVVPYFDNETIFYQLDHLPERLLVIGGGPIGLELGQAFARLGAKVTIAEFGDRVLAKEEPEASSLLSSVLQSEGIEILTRTKVEAARLVEGRALVSLASGAGQREERAFDAVLGAAGRRPNVEGLDLEAAGVQLDARGFIHVDASMRTSVPSIFAVGDVIGKFPFTHMAEAEARVALRNALFPGRGRMDYTVVPWATFTDPEVARVGALEADLVARHEPYRVFTMPFAEADRAITDGSTQGFIKLLTSPRGQILGATVVGRHAGELIHEYVIAMKHRTSVQSISQTIHVYPTLALANRRAADQYLREQLTNSWGGKVLRWWVSLKV